jgi:hypothetical protein
MSRTSAAVGVVMMAVVVGACGSTAPVAPSPVPSPAPAPAPAPQIPSLVGEWRSQGNVSFDEPSGWRGSYSCSGSWSIGSQVGVEFSGTARWEGNGFNGDRYCSYSGEVNGVVNADRTVTVRFTPIFRTRCSQIAGDGTMTGSMNADGTVTIQSSAAATCLHDPLGHSTDVMRTFTMTITRR